MHRRIIGEEPPLIALIRRHQRRDHAASQLAPPPSGRLLDSRSKCARGRTSLGIQMPPCSIIRLCSNLIVWPEAPPTRLAVEWKPLSLADDPRRWRNKCAAGDPRILLPSRSVRRTGPWSNCGGAGHFLRQITQMDSATPDEIEGRMNRCPTMSYGSEQNAWISADASRRGSQCSQAVQTPAISAGNAPHRALLSCRYRWANSPIIPYACRLRFVSCGNYVLVEAVDHKEMKRRTAARCIRFLRERRVR